ncbi:MAG: hypothetical protein KAH99_01625 [Verrucomicrobia bacterium]|nr:hypothetical protein [Verrucomicrobiota bacterium]
MDASSLNQLFLAFIMLIPIVLVARAVVAGTKYSPILIIVVFGLLMGFLLERSGVAAAGLPDLVIIDLMSKETVIVLIVAFFVGGQELNKIITKKRLEIEDLVIPSQEEVILGTKRTQLFFIIRSFFILLAIQGAYALIMGKTGEGSMAKSYPILTYLGFMGAIIIIDSRATIRNKHLYLIKGLAEMAAILALLIASFFVSKWVKPFIPLPQIFFAMLLSATLGSLLKNWRFGPTMRSLLFAGIPVVLAANFLIGGSRMLQAFSIGGMSKVIGYGFFGQLLWMFGGLLLLIKFGKANHVRNLAPGMAGSLSHSGLTGACTAEDLGPEAAARAPIMINVPFFGHLFVFTILAYSAARGSLVVLPAAAVALLGAALTVLSLRKLRKAEGREVAEVNGLMLFCFGWQLTAVFGSFILQHFGGVPINNAAMGASSAISHFGLFAAVQGGMFGSEAAGLIPFIFAMPFLVHPLVFGMFGRAMKKDGTMPVKPVYLLTAIGFAGSLWFLFVL